MTKLLSAFVAASVASTAAMAGTTSSADPQAAASPPAPMARATPKPKVICRTEDAIGSRLGGHRECHTEAEWRAIAQDSSDYLTEMRNHRSGQY